MKKQILSLAVAAAFAAPVAMAGISGEIDYDFSSTEADDSFSGANGGDFLLEWTASSETTNGWGVSSLVGLANGETDDVKFTVTTPGGAITFCGQCDSSMEKATVDHGDVSGYWAVSSTSKDVVVYTGKAGDVTFGAAAGMSVANDDMIDSWAVYGKYSAGAIAAGATYQKIVFTGDSKFAIGGRFTAGAASLGASYEMAKDDAADEEQVTWGVRGRYTMDAIGLTAGWNTTDGGITDVTNNPGLVGGYIEDSTTTHFSVSYDFGGGLSTEFEYKMYNDEHQSGGAGENDLNTTSLNVSYDF